MAVEVTSYKVVDLLLGFGMQVLELVHGTEGDKLEKKSKFNTAREAHTDKCSYLNLTTFKPFGRTRSTREKVKKLINKFFKK